MKCAVLGVLLVLWPGLASGAALMIRADFEPTEKDFPTCGVPAPAPFQRRAIDLGLIDIVQLQPSGSCVVLRDANGPIQTIIFANHDFTGGYQGDVIQKDGYVYFALYFSAGWLDHVAVGGRDGRLVEMPMPLLQGIGHMINSILDSRSAASSGPGR